MLMVIHKHPDEVRIIGEELGGPLMYMSYPGGIMGMPHTTPEMHALGYRIIVDPTTPLVAAFAALRNCYRRIGQHPSAVIDGGVETAKEIEADIHSLIDLESLLKMESRQG